MKIDFKKENNRLIIIVIIGFIIMCFISCAPKNKKEIIGTYIANYDAARERLILQSDGTFIQEVVIKSTKKNIFAKGKWEYDNETGYITFNDNFILVLDAFGKIIPDCDIPKPGLVVYPVMKCLFWVFIEGGEDVLYKKED